MINCVLVQVWLGHTAPWRQRENILFKAKSGSLVISVLHVIMHEMFEELQGLPAVGVFDCYVYGILWGILNVSGLMVAKPEDVPQAEVG